MRLFFWCGVLFLGVVVALAAVLVVAWGDAGKCAWLVSGDEYDAAFPYCERAAAGGSATAQYDLGRIYENGEGVSEDKVAAVRWYRLAAVQGVARAQFNLGYMYRSGEGVSADEVEALGWYRLAAGQGHARALYNLGLMYYFGHGVSVDKRDAFVLFSLAVIFGYGDAAERRDGVEGELSAGDVQWARGEVQRRLAAIRGR